jgi:hypothetical protein
MICIYEASIAVEAHMIINLLQQSDIQAYIHGEHLQGGVGELQAIGIVRVMINEADKIKAKKIIEEWEKKQPTPDIESSLPAKKSKGITKFIVGFALGAVVLGIYYNTPVSYDGIDFNGDGVLDERWTFRNYRLIKTEVDRNFDGKVDFIHEFNGKSWIKKSLADNDFNGSFESTVFYDKGNASFQKCDYDGDGFEEYQIEYNNGVLNKVRFFNPSSKSVIKIQYYEVGKLVRAEHDSNSDDIIDTVTKYDEYEQIVSTKPK